MAIHDDLPGIEVSITIDGDPVNEYQVDNDEIKDVSGNAKLHQAGVTNTMYIEAVTNKEFAVELDMRPPYEINCPALEFQVFVDGVWIRAPLAMEDELERNDGHWNTVVHGRKAGQTGTMGTLKNFKFSEIKTTATNGDRAKIDHDSEVISKVGDIVVKIFRCGDLIQLQKHREPGKLEGKYGARYHEKALQGKFKSHGVSLGQESPVHVGRIYECDRLDGEDYPIGIFHFKYRSRLFLQKLLVIDPDPEDEILQDDTLLDCTPAQKKAIAKLLKVAGSKRNRDEVEDEDTLLDAPRQPALFGLQWRPAQDVRDLPIRAKKTKLMLTNGEYTNADVMGEVLGVGKHQLMLTNGQNIDIDDSGRVNESQLMLTNGMDLDFGNSKDELDYDKRFRANST